MLSCRLLGVWHDLVHWIWPRRGACGRDRAAQLDRWNFDRPRSRIFGLLRDKILEARVSLRSAFQRQAEGMSGVGAENLQR